MKKITSLAQPSKTYNITQKSHYHTHWKKKFNYFGMKTSTFTVKAIKQIVKNNSKNTNFQSNTCLQKSAAWIANNFTLKKRVKMCNCL